MKHFGIEQWTDFVRGLVEEKRQAVMEKHLSLGCKSCQRLANLLQQVVRAGKLEGLYEVPEYAVRRAKVVHALQDPQAIRSLPRILARLVYDSFREPLPAGVRSQQRLSREALYHAGRFEVDLRLEREKDTGQVTIVGQIASRTEPAKEMSGVPVFLASKKEIMARTVSNRFGEFQAQYQPQRHMRLYVLVNNTGEKIEISLDRLMAETTARRNLT